MLNSFSHLLNPGPELRKLSITFTSATFQRDLLFSSTVLLFLEIARRERRFGFCHFLLLNKIDRNIVKVMLNYSDKTP